MTERSGEQALVGIIMGSISDRPVMQKAADVLTILEVRWEMHIRSAHRTPDWMVKYAREAEDRGIKVIIAGAGGSAHLPGMTASETLLPVLGVPIKGSMLDGMDALYSMIRMPDGVPLATMNIDGARNAGLMAARILALQDESLTERLRIFRAGLVTEVINANLRLQEELKDKI